MQELVDLLVRVVKVLRMCDSNQPCAGFLYQAMFDLRIAYDFESDDRSSWTFHFSLASIVSDRWKFMQNDWLSAAYILNRRYWHLLDDICDNAEVWEGVVRIITKLSKSPREAALALNEFTVFYRGRTGSFGGPVALASSKMDKIAPHTFWMLYVSITKNLKPLAIRICSKSAASSACETNWSNVDFILNKRRTKLTNERVEKLLFCYSNKLVAKKLLARTGEEEYYNRQTVRRCTDHLEQSLRGHVLGRLLDEK